MKKKTTPKAEIIRITPKLDTGLSSIQAEERINCGYANIAVDPNEKSTAKIIMSNLFTFFNAVLFTIALVFLGFVIYFSSIGRSDIVNAYFGFSKFFFLVPALLNFAMGTVQEIRSLKVIKKLRLVTESKSRVIRDGKVITTDAGRIVIDDVVLLKAGEQATADLTVAEGDIRADESMLTGESDPVRKKPGDTVYSGSVIIAGDAKCYASAVGDDTYTAKLSKKVKSGARHKSELMSAIMRIIKVLTVVLGLVVLAVTVTLALKISKHGNDPTVWNGLTLSLSDPLSWGLIAVTGGSFGIGVIPSGLVLTTSVTMLVSIVQLAKKQTLIQELYSLENLSRIDVICLDKTGTLTDGSMKLTDVKYYAAAEDVEKYARELIGAFGDRNATAEAVYERFGAEEKAVYKEKIPFSSALKYSGIVYEDGKKLLMGAPEYLLNKDDERLGYVTERAEEGFRVIALTLDGDLLAFFEITDHIRDTAADTLNFFRENGVTVKVISGDNPVTVSRIAKNCGIVNADRYISLEGMPIEKIKDVAEDNTVFARVSPEQKEALVTALQSEGHKVAMTGDGVNDILALRKSDSSITFANATDAAKSCSDVVLLDNDFSHLKEVFGEGRRVIGNIQRTAVLYLMKSVAVALLAFALIPFAKGQMWFSIENMYMLELSVIGIGGFFLSLEPRRVPIVGSFIKKIRMQAISAGALAATAILLPIMLNTLPRYLGLDPFISDGNVKPMMTLLMTLSGFVVIFAMCIPFTRYRTLSLTILTCTAGLLGMIAPAAYVGGQTIGKLMFSYDKAAGQSIFDSVFFREMFRPWNSPLIRRLFSDINNFFLLRIFLYAAIPLFIIAMFAAENYARKGYEKIDSRGSALRSGKRMLLSSGLVLMLRSSISVAELIFSGGHIVVFSGSAGVHTAFGKIMVAAYTAFYFVIGFLGYMVWKKPTKSNVAAAFISGMVLMGLTVIGIITAGGALSRGDFLTNIDEIMLIIIALWYYIGTVITRALYDTATSKEAE